jgi:hypothetical protein
MNTASVDLIYLDPPFNSNANYAAPIGSEAAGAEFKDTWTLDDVNIAWLDLIESKHPALNRVIHAAMTNSDKSYLIYMAVQIYRILLLEMVNAQATQPKSPLLYSIESSKPHLTKARLFSIRFVGVPQPS